MPNTVKHGFKAAFWGLTLLNIALPLMESIMGYLYHTQED